MKQLTDDNFRSLLNIIMMSDDVNLDGVDRRAIMGLLDVESNQRGFKDWVEAYHKQE